MKKANTLGSSVMKWLQALPRRKKLILAVSAVAVLGLAVLLALLLRPAPAAPATGVELLENGDLSASVDGLPEGWYQDAYFQGEYYTSYELVEDSEMGGMAMHITNHALNDARIAQIVTVEPNSLYCLSGFIKADVEGGWGANLSIAGVFTSSDRCYDTEGGWQQVTLYGRTSPEQETLTVFARLGGYSGESQGEAWFTGLSLTRVSEVPDGAAVVNFYTASDSSAKDGPVLKLDMRHVLLMAFLLLYGLMLVSFARAGSLTGMFLLCAGLTIMSLMAVYMGEVGNNEAVLRYNDPLPYVKYIFLLLDVLTLLAGIWVVRRGAQRGDAVRLAAEPKPGVSRFLGDERRNAGRGRAMDWKDSAAVLAITAAYAVLAVWNLGSMKAPQTMWTSSTANESIVIDLGEHHDDFTAVYYCGVSSSDFSLAVSDDGQSWSGEYWAQMKEGLCYQWKYLVPSYVQTDGPRGYSGTRSLDGVEHLSGRYVRVKAQQIGLKLGEIIFRDAEGNVIPATLVSQRGGLEESSLYTSGALAIDEPDSLEGEPSWYNSMYFDEIYHARTARELLDGNSIYEWTHPPLGKLIMSWGIALFGMTPFGWRISGAICGALMLPCMYLLGRLLFGKRRYALLPCLMLALDTLHYTQTRLATIDTYVVLFILWAVYFMLRWFYADFFGKKLWKTMVPLALSGLMMGLAIASKWPGCYAGLGLAVVFFFGIWRRYRAVLEAKSLPEGERDAIARTAAEEGVRRLLLTVASCLIFFVLVPLAVYYCSYIPFFASMGGVSVSGIVGQIQAIFKYHNKPGFGMDHPYYMPWYRWFLSEKPMWYASASFTPEGSTYAIFALGNYAVWWPGFAALLLTLYACVRHQLIPMLTRGYDAKAYPLSQAGERDERPVLLLVTFAAQFVPWLLVPRGTYIYHYFPSLPFVMLMLVYVAGCMESWCVQYRLEKAGERAARRADRWCLVGVAVYLLVVLEMFVAFFPYASGMTVKQEWLDAVNWFGRLAY